MTNRTIELLPAKEQISLSASEWNVIAMFFRYPNLNTIAQKFNINEKQLDAVLDRLQAKKIVRVIDLKQEEAVSVEIPSFFWEHLEKELSKSRNLT
jgi:DNA-binding MarR family transcriptional regulator